MRLDVTLSLHVTLLLTVVLYPRGHGGQTYVIRADTRGSKQDHMKYLSEYGYLDPSTSPNDIQAFQDAVIRFQNTWGLKPTGIIDDATIKLMENPRCGNSDFEQNGGSKSHGFNNGTAKVRKKRFSILPYGGWGKKNLTYRVRNRPKTLTSAQVLDAIGRAFRQWSRVSPLKFTRIYTKPDIDILFASYRHGDGVFDGIGGTVAHTYFPVYGGDLHFDASENWTLGTGKGTDLFQTAVHEIGHALGLSHSQSKDAVMYPYYQYLHPWKLSPDDTGGIQFLYGDPRSNISQTYQDFCNNPKIDGATTNSHGDIFVFIGKYYIYVNGGGIASGYPRLIRQGMPELPDHIDAAVHLPAVTAPRCRATRGRRVCMGARVIESERTYIFKGVSYYMYSGEDQFEEMGKISSRFPGVPNHIDAAFAMDGKHIYFVKGKNYWRVERGSRPQLPRGFPKPLARDFHGLPERINAAFTLTLYRRNTKAHYNFFFKDSKYYRITNTAFKVDKSHRPFPRIIGPDWFDCPKSARLIAMIQSGRNSRDETIWETINRMKKENPNIKPEIEAERANQIESTSIESGDIKDVIESVSVSHVKNDEHYVVDNRDDVVDGMSFTTDSTVEGQFVSSEGKNKQRHNRKKHNHHRTNTHNSNNNSIVNTTADHNSYSYRHDNIDNQYHNNIDKDQKNIDQNQNNSINNNNSSEIYSSDNDSHLNNKTEVDVSSIELSDDGEIVNFVIFAVIVLLCSLNLILLSVYMSLFRRKT